MNQLLDNMILLLHIMNKLFKVHLNSNTSFMCYDEDIVSKEIVDGFSSRI